MWQNEPRVDITGGSVRVGRRGLCVHRPLGLFGIDESERCWQLLQFVGAGFSRRPAQPEKGGATRVRTPRRPLRSDGQCPLWVARPELLQGEVLPLFWGYARRDVVLALCGADWPLSVSKSRRGDFLWGRFPGQHGSVVRALAALLCRSQRCGGGGRRARTGFGHVHAVAVGAV